MAHRSIKRKQANRLRKAFRDELPRHIDLIQWLKDRGYADTTGQAEKIILAGRVRSDSHKLGFASREVPVRLTRAEAMTAAQTGQEIKFEERSVVTPHVPAALRDTITVLPA